MTNLGAMPKVRSRTADAKAPHGRFFLLNQKFLVQLFTKSCEGGCLAAFTAYKAAKAQAPRPIT